MTKTFLHAAALALALAGCASAPPPLAYPATPTVAQTDSYFGTTVADPYRWLEDDNAAQTKAWVAAQNRVTDGVLDAIAFRPALRERLRALANYARYSAPFQKNGWLFFYKNDGLQNQSVLYVQRGAAGAPEVLLDPNTFSADGTVRLASFRLSRDGRYAVYAKTAIPGSDWQDLYVLDMTTRRTLPEVLHWVKFSGTAWRGDGFYYSRYAAPSPGSELTTRAENQKVYFHRVGTEQDSDTLVYEDPAHPTRLVGVDTTEDERFAVLQSFQFGRRGNDLFVRDERAGERSFRPIVAEIGDARFDVIDSVGNELLVATTLGAPNRRVVRVDPARPAPSDWATVLPERPEVLQHVTSAGGRLFANYLKDVRSQIQVF
ncbi:MAG TPA: S9 family peptidase, partial [Burkholderiaceae bacterium]|nr:S9 family peptidase [Burkholderiaceae bacterium]